MRKSLTLAAGLIVLVGCSTQAWVSTSDNAVNPDALELAMEACDYHERQSYANELSFRASEASSQLQRMDPLAEETRQRVVSDDTYARTLRDQSIEATAELNECMALAGFKRVDT